MGYRRRTRVEWAQIHDLRRANATGLILEGIDLKTAQTRLGHTDPRLTLGIYAQATTEADAKPPTASGRGSFRAETKTVAEASCSACILDSSVY